MHVSLSLLCLAIDVLSGACVCAQIIGTFSAFPWADSVSGAVLVLGSSECLSLCVQVFFSVLFQELTGLSGGTGNPDS